MSEKPRKQAVVSALRGCPLFEGLEFQELSNLASYARFAQVHKGEVIFREGESADRLFVLNKGRIRLYKLSEDGREQSLRMVRPGEAFAEAAMFTGRTYPVYAEAARDSTVVSITREGFIEAVGKNPALALNLIGNLAGLLRRVTDLVEDLSLREVSSRLARFLIEYPRPETSLRPGSSVELDLTRRELAKRLGTTAETLSRTLRKLSDRGIIEVKGRTIVILEPRVLWDVAGGKKVESF